MFQPIATLIVGIGVIFFAFLQWKVAHDKLRLDLFDRRYKVYEATRKFLAVIIQRAAFDNSQLFEFYAGTSDAEFLFGSEVVAYLAEIRKRAINMQTHQKIYEHMPVGDERSRHVQTESDQLLWLGDQITAMTKIFTPYLGYANIKGNFLEELVRKLEA